MKVPGIVVLDVGDDYFHPSPEGWRWDWPYPVSEFVRHFERAIPVRQFLFWGRIASRAAPAGDVQYSFPANERIRIIGARASGARGARSHVAALPYIVTRGVAAVAKADIIIFRWPSLHSALLLPLALLMRKTVVIRLRVDVEEGLRMAGAIRSRRIAGAFGSYTRWALRRATVPVCVSEFLKKKYGNDKTAVLNECVVSDADLAPAEDRSGPPTVLYVGRLSHEKGVDILIRAFAQMKATSARLVIVGGGVQEQRLRDLARSLGVMERVVFAGVVADRTQLAEWYRSSTVFVLPSRSEGLGCVLLESMAAGTPIVASNVGGIPDLVRNGDNGLLVPADDTESLALAIDRLLSDATLRREFAIRGTAVASTKTFEKQTTALIDLALTAWKRKNGDLHQAADPPSPVTSADR